MLRALNERREFMPEYMGNIRKEEGSLIKNQREILKIKTISKLDMAKEKKQWEKLPNYLNEELYRDSLPGNIAWKGSTKNSFTVEKPESNQDGLSRMSKYIMIHSGNGRLLLSTKKKWAIKLWEDTQEP